MQNNKEGISFDNLLRSRHDFESFREDICTKRDKVAQSKHLNTRLKCH